METEHLNFTLVANAAGPLVLRFTSSDEMMDMALVLASDLGHLCSISTVTSKKHEPGYARNIYSYKIHLTLINKGNRGRVLMYLNQTTQSPLNPRNN